MNAVRSYFQIDARGSTVPTELRAGLVTFLTMAYVLAVNPQVLSQAGLPPGDVVFATAVGSAFATMLMGLWARLPFALAPGMGLNAWFTFGVVQGMGVDWRLALAAVFVEGAIFLVLSLVGARTALLRAVPTPVKLATTVGIGLFLALIGLRNAGLVRPSAATMVELGDLNAPATWLSLGSLILVGVLWARRVKGALLISIGATALVAWLTGLAAWPDRLVDLPRWPSETAFAFGFEGLLTIKFAGIVLAFLFVDIFDTAGVLFGVSRAGGMLDSHGELPNSDKAFAADAAGTMAGALLGTSTVTTYLESAAGVEEGGKTGLTAVVVSVLFLLALFFTPVFAAIPAVATAPVLIAIGAAMVGAARELELSRFDDALPAFLTLALMPFTFSIANGIAAGIVSWVALKLLSGRHREVNAPVAVIAALLVGWYVLGR